jgi:hypothetical protein
VRCRRRVRALRSRPGPPRSEAGAGLSGPRPAIAAGPAPRILGHRTGSHVQAARRRHDCECGS